MDVIVILRMVLALACVLGLLWFIGRRTGARGPAARRAPAVTLIGRQSLGGRSAVALVEVAGRRLVLGVGEQGVTLLAEVEMPTPTDADRVALDTAELERLLDPIAGPLDPRDDIPVTTLQSSPAARKPAVPTPRNPLEGSILDATTWRRAVEAVQERTIRH